MDMPVMPISQSKKHPEGLMTRDRGKRLVEVYPRYLGKALGDKPHLVPFDLPLRIQLGLEDPFTPYHLPTDGSRDRAEDLLSNKLLEFFSTRLLPVPCVTL